MDTAFVSIGKALSAPARSAMMSLLLDGQPHSATELAAVAGVAAGTASEHLAVLVESAMVTAERRGRSRLFAIADAETAAALEALGRPPEAPATSLRMDAERRRVRAARTCYDHLAGELGVRVTT